MVPTLSSSWATLLAPNQGRGHAWVAQRPGRRHLWERLAAAGRDLVQRPHLGHRLLREEVGRQRVVPARPRALRDAVQVAVGEQSLGERREGYAAHALVPERVEQV